MGRTRTVLVENKRNAYKILGEPPARKGSTWKMPAPTKGDLTRVTKTCCVRTHATEKTFPFPVFLFDSPTQSLSAYADVSIEGRNGAISCLTSAHVAFRTREPNALSEQHNLPHRLAGMCHN
jgi:hypothetical protein